MLFIEQYIDPHAFFMKSLGFQKQCNSFFYLHFLMNKMIYTIYHILNCMMGLILENYWMFPTRLWTQNATLILRWYAIYETRFIDISSSMTFIVVQHSVKNTWKKLFIGYHYVSLSTVLKVNIVFYGIVNIVAHLKSRA